MDIIHGGRASGKTHQIIERMLERDDIILLSHSPREALRSRDLYKKIRAERGMDPDPNLNNRFTSVGNMGSGRPRMNVIIDNADLILQQFAGINPIESIYLTASDAKEIGVTA